MSFLEWFIEWLILLIFPFALFTTFICWALDIHLFFFKKIGWDKKGYSTMYFGEREHGKKIPTFWRLVLWQPAFIVAGTLITLFVWVAKLQN